MRQTRTATKARHELTLVLAACATCGLAVFRVARGERPQAVKAASAHVEPDRSAVLASFDGGEIRLGALLDAIAARPPALRRELAQPGALLALTRDLETYALLIDEAERRGYAGAASVRMAGEKAAIDAMVERALRVDPAAVSSEALQRAYEERRSRYVRPELRRASEVVVATEREARALARTLRRASRAQFEEAARKRSLDEPTRKQGGELGWFSRAAMGTGGRPSAVSKELIAAAFALPRVGAVTRKPIADQDGRFALLMLTGKLPAVSTPLAKVEDELRETLARDERNAAVDQLVDELRARVHIETHPELWKVIQLDDGATGGLPRGDAPYPVDPRVGPHMVPPDKD